MNSLALYQRSSNPSSWWSPFGASDNDSVAVYSFLRCTYEVETKTPVIFIGFSEVHVNDIDFYKRHKHREWFLNFNVKEGELLRYAFSYSPGTVTLVVGRGAMAGNGTYPPFQQQLISTFNKERRAASTVVLSLGLANVDFIEYFRDFCLQYGVECVPEMVAHTGVEMGLDDMDDRRVCPGRSPLTLFIHFHSSLTKVNVGCGQKFADLVELFEHFDNNEYCTFTCDCGQKVKDRRVMESEHLGHYYRCGNCHLRADYMELQEHLLDSLECIAGLQKSRDMELFGPDDSNDDQKVKTKPKTVDKNQRAKPESDSEDDEALLKKLRRCRLPSPIHKVKGSVRTKRQVDKSPEPIVQSGPTMRGRGLSVGGVRKISRGNLQSDEVRGRLTGIGHGRRRSNAEPGPPRPVSRGIGMIRRAKPVRR